MGKKKRGKTGKVGARNLTPTNSLRIGHSYVNSSLNPWIQGGYRVQDIGFIVESKNPSFTLRLSGHFLNRCGIKSLCYAPS